jgi:integrase
LAKKHGTRGPNQLTAAGLAKKLREPGLHTDGGGLYLRVGQSGRQRSWLLIHQFDDRRREMGLGSADTVSLARAREKAREARDLIDRGIDPVANRRAAKAIPTFGKIADDWIEAQTPNVRSEKSVARWRRAVGVGGYSEVLRGKRVDAITADDVLNVLRPIWHAKATTARNVRGYVEAVLDAAKARKLREGDNPAAWEGNLEPLLGASKRSTDGHSALAWRDMPAFWSTLSARSGSTSAKALQFTILTVARTGESIGLRKKEIDVTRRVWTVPAERMKGGVEHEVALSDAAMAILADMNLDALGADDYVFPSPTPGQPLSNMAMLVLLQKRMKRSETVHGFRSAFRDWCGDGTEYPRELAEMALAHAIDSDVEAAYRRGRALERRRAVMRDWAGFLDGRLAPLSHEEVPPVRKSVLPIASIPIANIAKGKVVHKDNPLQVSLFGATG